MGHIMRMIIMIGTMSAPNKGTLRMTVHKNVQNRADETQKSNMIKISRGAFVKISERERCLCQIVGGIPWRQLTEIG